MPGQTCTSCPQDGFNPSCQSSSMCTCIPLSNHHGKKHVAGITQARRNTLKYGMCESCSFAAAPSEPSHECRAGVFNDSTNRSSAHRMSGWFFTDSSKTLAPLFVCFLVGFQTVYVLWYHAQAATRRAHPTCERSPQVAKISVHGFQPLVCSAFAPSEGWRIRHGLP